MSNLFLPEQFLKRVLPAGFFKNRLLTRALTIKQTLIRAIVTAAAINEEELEETTSKVVDFYQEKIERLDAEGVDKSKQKAVNGEKLLKQRVENLLTWNESRKLKAANLGKKYIWLPSSSKEPRPLHQLRYGKVYTVGDGLFPAEEYGCKCGALILDNDNNDVLTSKQEREIEEQRGYDKAAALALRNLKKRRNKSNG